MPRQKESHNLYPPLIVANVQLEKSPIMAPVCTYNWIADYTIIMRVHKITWILKISRGLLANQNADSEYNV